MDQAQLNPANYQVSDYYYFKFLLSKAIITSSTFECPPRQPHNSAFYMCTIFTVPSLNLCIHLIHHCDHSVSLKTLCPSSCFSPENKLLGCWSPCHPLGVMKAFLGPAWTVESAMNINHPLPLTLFYSLLFPSFSPRFQSPLMVEEQFVVANYPAHFLGCGRKLERSEQTHKQRQHANAEVRIDPGH